MFCGFPYRDAEVEDPGEEDGEELPSLDPLHRPLTGDKDLNHHSKNKTLKPYRAKKAIECGTPGKKSLKKVF